MMVTTMRPEEYAVYCTMGARLAGGPGGLALLSRDYDAEYVGLTTIAVAKRFWQEASRAAAISAGLEAVEGSTPESRALAAVAEEFWQGSMIQDAVKNHAVCGEVI
jgi:hypothetical protein